MNLVRFLLLLTLPVLLACSSRSAPLDESGLSPVAPEVVEYSARPAEARVEAPSALAEEIAGGILVVPTGFPTVIPTVIPTVVPPLAPAVASGDEPAGAIPVALPPGESVLSPDDLLREPVLLEDVLPSGDPPGVILQDSVSAMEDLVSYSYLMEFVTKIDGIEPAGLLGMMNARVSGGGAVSLPDRERVSLTMDLAGFMSFDIRVIRVGSLTYVLNPFTGEWEPDDGSFESPGPPVAMFDEDFLVDLEYVGLEELPGGMVVHHLLFMPDPAVLEGHLLDPGEGVESLEAHYWVGRDDLLVHRIRVGLRQQLPDGLADISTVVRILEHNEPVVIELPELSEPVPSG